MWDPCGRSTGLKGCSTTGSLSGSRGAAMKSPSRKMMEIRSEESVHPACTGRNGTSHERAHDGYTGDHPSASETRSIHTSKQGSASPKRRCNNSAISLQRRIHMRPREDAGQHRKSPDRSGWALSSNQGAHCGIVIPARGGTCACFRARLKPTDLHSATPYDHRRKTSSASAVSICSVKRRW